LSPTLDLKSLFASIGNRAYLRDLKVEQRNQWIADARIFKETWADDAATWYYFNEATGKCAGWATYGK
jgi:hypothetical protein